MNREEVYKEMEEMFGLVPSFFKLIPDSSLDLEWQLFNRVQLEPGPVPQKYRELIGIALSGVMKCRFCALFHTEAAKLNGATDAEIEDAVHFAKSSAGWSTYINGMQIDYDQFKSEMSRVSEYIREKQGLELELSCRDVGVDCDFVARGKTEDEIFEQTRNTARPPTIWRRFHLNSLRSVGHSFTWPPKPKPETCVDRDGRVAPRVTIITSFSDYSYDRRRCTMEKLLRCSDVAALDCEFEGCEPTEEQVLKAVLDHARTLHGFKGDLTEKERGRVHSAIREAFCVFKSGYGRRAF